MAKDEVAVADPCSSGNSPTNMRGFSQAFFSISEVAERWRCSRATVYNRLRQVGAKVLDFAPKGKKGKKAVPASLVTQIENRHIKRLS